LHDVKAAGLGGDNRNRQAAFQIRGIRAGGNDRVAALGLQAFADVLYRFLKPILSGTISAFASYSTMMSRNISNRREIDTVQITGLSCVSRDGNGGCFIFVSILKNVFHFSFYETSL
jgi:hypothetical protein